MNTYDHWMGFPASHLVDYPLPRHAQTPPVSSYSSLSHALDPSLSPAYAIYSTTSSGHTSYPYPRTGTVGTNRVPRTATSSVGLAKMYASPPEPNPNASVGPVRTRPRHHSHSHAKGPSVQSYAIQAQAVNIPRAPLHLTRLPQPKCTETSTYIADSRLLNITFQRADSMDLGVRVGDMVYSKYNPDIRGAQERVLEVAPDRYIKVSILWPGYSKDPFQKRLKTQNCEITREALLLLIAQAVLEFADRIRKERVPVERGHERWAIGRRPDGSKGIDGADVVITSLRNRLGATWQPELYVPI